MLQILSALILLFLQESPVTITSPTSGETLRGQVNIVGNMSVSNFASAELAIAYTNDHSSTWFPIQTFSSLVADSALFVWDTTTISDDDYTLRLRVYLQDGSFQEVIVNDIRIRNDVPVPTDTPTLPPDIVSNEPLPTASPVPATAVRTFPTPTPFPSNPASLAASYIYSSFGRGALLVLVLFFIVGLFLRLRRP
jgi:hypothetical protein